MDAPALTANDTIILTGDSSGEGSEDSCFEGSSKDETPLERVGRYLPLL